MPKRIVITGGSSGIGKALVRRFTEDGWIVAFTYLKHSEEAQALARESGALCYCCDVRDEDSVKTASGEILRLMHHIVYMFSADGTGNIRYCYIDNS